MKDKITIVGAGLVGCLMARLLAKRGYTVEVYDLRSDPRSVSQDGGRSINLALSDRGWRALDRADVADRVRPLGLPMKGRRLHGVDGKMNFQAYGEEGQAIYSVSRGDLNRILLESAEELGADFYFESKLLDVDLRRKELKIEVAGGKVKCVPVQRLLGCDGAFSRVRYRLLRTSRFNYRQEYLNYGYKEVHFPAGPNGEHVFAPDGLHIWPRGNFMLIGLPNPDGTFTGTLFLPFEGNPSFAEISDPMKARDFFGKYFPDALPKLPDLESDWIAHPTSSLVTIYSSPWYYQDWILLLGDASHAIVPFYGQGMNSGFEDCYLLDKMLEESDDWSTILPSFSEGRIPDAHAIAELALRNFVEMRDQVADPKFLLRKKIAGELHRRHGDEFLPVYSQVTFSELPYRQALAADDAQDILFERILALPGIQNNWEENPKVDEVFREWQKEFL